MLRTPMLTLPQPWANFVSAERQPVVNFNVSYPQNWRFPMSVVIRAHHDLNMLAIGEIYQFVPGDELAQWFRPTLGRIVGEAVIDNVHASIECFQPQAIAGALQYCSKRALPTRWHAEIVDAVAYERPIKPDTFDKYDNFEVLRDSQIIGPVAASYDLSLSRNLQASSVHSLY